MKRDNARMAVYALGGAYLIYLAWELFSGLDTAGSEKPLMLVFGILFAVIGAAAVAGGLYSGWKRMKDMQQPASGSVPESEKEKDREEDGKAPESEPLAENGETPEKIEEK